MPSPINTCECNSPSCLVKHNRFLRTIIVIIQSIFIVFVAILAAIIFQRRKIKIIKHSMWILLELILFGAALLYASVIKQDSISINHFNSFSIQVIVDSFSPDGIVCLIMPWYVRSSYYVIKNTR
jgi:hypothetical protein